MKALRVLIDALVEVPKLHKIKLLIASFYTHIDYNCHDEYFYCVQNPESQGNSKSGYDQP